MTPKTITSRLRNKEGGFTLVELMVVVMIIAILMAIAIPTFLNSRKRAQDASAKSNVRNGLAAAQSVFSEEQAYGATADMVADLLAEEPSLAFTDGASGDPKSVSVVTDPGNATIVMSVLAKSDTCFSLKHVAASPGGTTEYQKKDATSTTCQATLTPVSD